jgi:hypothetical protein
MSRMNSIIEGWVQTCRRELLDRTLSWNQHHLLHALRECETSKTPTGLTRASRTSARCTPCRSRSSIRGSSPVSVYEGASARAACSTSTDMPRDLHGRGIRQGHGCRPHLDHVLSALSVLGRLRGLSAIGACGPCRAVSGRLEDVQKVLTGMSGSPVDRVGVKIQGIVMSCGRWSSSAIDHEVRIPN